MGTPTVTCKPITLVFPTVDVSLTATVDVSLTATVDVSLTATVGVSLTATGEEPAVESSRLL